MAAPATSQPDFSRPVDVGAHVAALAPTAAARGFFFIELLKVLSSKAPGVDPFAATGVEQVNYRSFKEYAYRDFIKLNVFAAQTLHPDEPLGEGLRRLGHGAYDVFVSTQVGRVLLGAVGKNFARVAKLGCRAYSTSMNFGKVEWTRLGDREGYYTFTDFPAMIASYQVGVIEGGMRAVDTRGEITVATEGVGNGHIHIRWE